MLGIVSALYGVSLKINKLTFTADFVKQYVAENGTAAHDRH